MFRSSSPSVYERAPLLTLILSANPRSGAQRRAGAEKDREKKFAAFMRSSEARKAHAAECHAQ